MVWRKEDPQCAESRKIVWEVAPFLRGRGVDIGAGDFRVLPHVITVDDMSHAQFGFTHKPDVVADASDLKVFGSQTMDFVYSSHTLEHVEDMEKTLIEWWRLVKQGGYLILYLPHGDYYPKMGEEGANPDHKRDLWPRTTVKAMPTLPAWDLVECQERNEDQEYSFLLVFKKIAGRECRDSWSKPKPEKTACVVRYGAYGDVLQASSVFAGLKDQGYHVTVFASPPGSDVIQFDPNIDKLVLFDRDQVPNANVADFWRWQKRNYDHFVNLSESVEATWLALPGRTAHGWSPVIRHKFMNYNYLEFQHDLAGIPHNPQVKFYPTQDERVWARNFRDRMDTQGPIVVWSLAGSSVHKTWAGLDEMLARIMLEFPTVHVVLVCGPEGVILEAGWELEKRVHKTSGKWSMRQTLAFLEYADVIIGSETGVLNSASCLPAAKVCFLSHSSIENLTRDWKNTTSIWSHETTCKQRAGGVPACHQMHYGWAVCEKDEPTGTARCQADISHEEVWIAIATKICEAAMKRN